MTHSSTDIFLEGSTSRSSDVYLSIVYRNGHKPTSKIISMRGKIRRALRPSKGPQHIRGSITDIGTNGVCPFAQVKIEGLREDGDLSSVHVCEVRGIQIYFR